MLFKSSSSPSTTNEIHQHNFKSRNCRNIIIIIIDDTLRLILSLVLNTFLFWNFFLWLYLYVIHFVFSFLHLWEIRVGRPLLIFLNNVFNLLFIFREREKKQRYIIIVKREKEKNADMILKLDLNNNSNNTI